MWFAIQDLIRVQEIIGRPLGDDEFLEDLDPEARNDPINKIDTEVSSVVAIYLASTTK